MRKLVLTLAALAALAFIGSPSMDANAQATRGAAALKSAAKNFTPIEKVEKAACFGFWGRCRPGWHEVCGRYRCWCARC